jgi:hypothetical protein
MSLSLAQKRAMFPACDTQAVVCSVPPCLMEVDTISGRGIIRNDLKLTRHARPGAAWPCVSVPAL